MEWKILVRAGSNFPYLCHALGGGDIFLRDDADDSGSLFEASSPHLNELTSEDDAIRRAYSLGLLLNGALRIAEGWNKSRVIEFHEISAGGLSKTIAPHTIEEFPFSASLNLESASSDPIYPAIHPAAKLIQFSKDHEALRILMFQAGLLSTVTPEARILTWSTLYKILDTVSHFSKKLKWSVKSFDPQNQVNAFTAACNNMSVLGLESRHAKPDRSAPKSVITDLDEACDLMLSIARRFAAKFSSEVVKVPILSV